MVHLCCYNRNFFTHPCSMELNQILGLLQISNEGANRIRSKRRACKISSSFYSRTMAIGVHYVCLLILVALVAETAGNYDICFENLPATFLACNPESTDITTNVGVVSITIDPLDATCGTPATTYRRVGDDEEYICDATDSDLSHPLSNMIDSDPSSWWQSVSRTTSNNNLLVTIDIAFGKMFRLSGKVVLEFNYARPDMMVLEKSNDMGQTWTPLQYFARDCSDFSAEVDPEATFSEDDPLAVVCSQRYVERANLITEGRRVSYDLDERFNLFLGPTNVGDALFYPNLETKMLDDLLITNLRIRLVQPYDVGSNFDSFYAIQDTYVVARCFCNLHAASCQTQVGSIQCVCQHNTDGVNCERCQPLYNERPWQRGSYIPYPSGTANECLRCECNEHAESCTYNATYGRGVCNDCQHNTEGYHCEGCKSGFYPNTSKSVSDVDRCIDCNCHPLGIQDGNNACNMDLNSDILLGQCQCKPLVTNLRCDSCINGYYGLLVEPQGECKACECDPDGTSGQSNICVHEDGQCPCKSSTTGRQCSQCADTFFNFPTGNPQGECTLCGCNPGGSESLVCDKETGRCQCKEGITGDKCEGIDSGTYVPMIDTLVYEPASGDCQLTSDRWTDAEPFDGPGFKICDLSNSPANIAFDNVGGGMVQAALSWPYYAAIRYTNVGSRTITGTLSLTVTGDTSNSLLALSERLNTPVTPGCPLAREKTGEVTFSFAPGQSTASLSTDTKLEIDARCSYGLQLTLDRVGNSNGRRRRATIPENGIQIDSVVLSPNLSSADGNQKLEALAQSNNEEAVTQTYENCLQGLAVLTTRDQTLTNSSCRDLFFTVASDIYSATTDCGCSEIGAINPSQCASLGGQCYCKRNVGGRTCNTCLPGYFNLTVNGCEECANLPCPSPTTTPSPSDDSDNDRLHPGYIILIVLAVLVVLIAVACLLLYYYKKRRKKKPKKTVRQGIHALAHLGVRNPNSPLYSQDIHQSHYRWVAQNNLGNDKFVQSATPTSQMGSDGVFDSITPQPPMFFIDSEENVSNLGHTSKKRDRNENAVGERNHSRGKGKISNARSNQEDIYASPKKSKRPRSFSEPHNHRVKQEAISSNASSPLKHWQPVEDLRQTEFNFMDSPIESLDAYPYNNFTLPNGNTGDTLLAVENKPISQTEFNFMDSPVESTFDYTSNGFIPSNGFIQTLRDSDHSGNTIMNRDTYKPNKTIPQKPKRQKKPKSKSPIQRQSSALGKIYLPPPMYSGHINPAYVPDPDYSLLGDIEEPMVFIPQTDYPVYAGYDSYDIINGSLV